MTFTIKIKKRIHWSYKGNSGLKELNMFGKYQYIHSSPKGEISLIELTNDLYGDFRWEIYCLEGDLFEDVKRFKTKEEAERQIIKLLI